MTEPRRPRLRWVHIFWILVGLAGLYAALVIGQDIVSRVKLATVTRDIRADGLPLTWAEYTERFPESPQQAVAASNLIRALEAPPPVWNTSSTDRQENLPVEGLAKLPGPDVSLPPEMAAALEERLVQVATNLEAVREALADDTDLFLAPSRTNLFDVVKYSRFSKLRQGARLFKMRALFYADRNDPDRAMEAVIDGLRLAAVPSRARSMIEQLVGIACGDLAVGALETVLARADPSPARLKEVDTVLASLVSVNQAPVAELPFVSEGYDELMAMRPENKRDRDDLFASEDMRRWHGVLLGGPATRGALRLNKAWSLAVMHTAIRNWNLSWTDFQVSHSEASRAVPTLCFLSRTETDLLFAFKPHQLRMHGRRECARLALAVKSYAMAEGRLPEQLADLCPKYVAEIGTDPFSGQPFRYTLEGGNGTIGFFDPTTGRDIVFRVYPTADGRRQNAGN